MAKKLCKYRKGVEEHLPELTTLVDRPAYVCTSCARVANNKANLCSATELAIAPFERDSLKPKALPLLAPQPEQPVVLFDPKLALQPNAASAPDGKLSKKLRKKHDKLTKKLAKQRAKLDKLSRKIAKSAQTSSSTANKTHLASTSSPEGKIHKKALTTLH